MSTKRNILLSALILVALVIAVPKPEKLFVGILVSYIGFMFLNMYPFCFRFHLPGIIIFFVTAAAVLGIGYGWGTILHNSHGTAPGIVTFFGALLLVISCAGWVMCLMDWFVNIKSQGLVSESLYTKGMYALVRHPEVFFSLLLLIGFDLFYWSKALAWTTPLWMIGFVSYAAFEEKLELVPRFGEEYLTYCDTTPGILPNKSSISRFFGNYK